MTSRQKPRRSPLARRAIVLGALSLVLQLLLAARGESAALSELAVLGLAGSVVALVMGLRSPRR